MEGGKDGWRENEGGGMPRSTRKIGRGNSSVFLTLLFVSGNF